MKKKYYVFFIFLVLFFQINSINAITSAGTLSEKNKVAIYPWGSPYSQQMAEYNTLHYSIGGVYLNDSVDSTISSQTELVEAEDVYESLNLAKSACASFVKENKEEGYLCKEYPVKTAYACTGTIGGLVSTSNEYLEKYITGGVMFSTEYDCLLNCTGKCNLKEGYSFKYEKVIDTSSSDDTGNKSDIHTVGGLYLEAEDGNTSVLTPAFCIQPSKQFKMPNYRLSNGTPGKLIPQYCENTQLDLSTCKDNFYSDYRCGLAFIALKANGGSTTKPTTNNMTKDEFAVAETAMRMWATSRGYLGGMKNAYIQLYGNSYTTIDFYGITANRTQEDANYLAEGFACTTSQRNMGVLCDYKNIDLYKSAVKLYNEALHVNEIDLTADTIESKEASEILDIIANSTNRVPKLVTTSMTDSNNTIQITNPTGDDTVNCTEEDVKSGACRVQITYYDINGNEVAPDSTECSKNFCTAKFTNERLCSTEVQSSISIKVVIKNFEVSDGYIKEYHHCTNPSANQIIFTIKASGIEESKEDYINTYNSKVTCDCDDSTLKSTKGYIDSEGVEHEISEGDHHTCTNYDTMNTDSKDYNYYEVGYVKDPTIGQIVNNSCTKSKDYFRVKEYELAGSTCKVYCRNEIKFYMANKEKVYAGMQFRYELEEKITNNLNTGKHLTAIVYQERECVSEIDYDGWLKRYEDAEKAVAEAWNEWKKWDILLYAQNSSDVYPKQTSVVTKCTSNCAGFTDSVKNASDYKPSELYNNGEAASLKTCRDTIGASVNTIYLKSSSGIYESCDNYNGITRNYYSDDPYEILNSSENGTGVLAIRKQYNNKICAPRCITELQWTEQFYQKFDYSSGENVSTSSSYNGTESRRSISNYSCTIGEYINLNDCSHATVSYETVDGVAKEDGCTYYAESDTSLCRRINYQDCSEMKKIYKGDVYFKLKIDSIPSVVFDSLTDKIRKKFTDDFPTDVNRDDYYIIFDSPLYKENLSDNIAKIYYYAEDTSSSCTDGTDDDATIVYKNAEAAKEKYNAAQNAVQELLTQLQQCNLFGSGLEGDSEPDIIYYLLTEAKAPSGTTGGYGGGGGGGEGGSNTGTSASDVEIEGSYYGKGANEGETTDDSGTTLVVDNPTVKNVNLDVTDSSGKTVEYSATQMVADPNIEYNVEQIVSTSTNNTNSIKRRLLKNASCADDETCVDLNLSYEDTVYGADLKYDKEVGIVNTKNLYNVYCTDHCYQTNPVSYGEKLDDSWSSDVEEHQTTTRRILCHTQDEDVSKHYCEWVDTVLPNSKFVSFIITTEVDFYRQKNYYTKAYTGEVIESNTASKVNSKIYSALGQNVYPTASDSINAAFRNHYVNYQFTNLNISKFGNSNSVNLDNYEYQCSYEVYNNTTGYDCVPTYDSKGNPIPSDCSNFCFYVEDSVPNLECIYWNGTGGTKSYGFIYRNVDLSDLFPNSRQYGTNWNSSNEQINQIIKDIQNSANSLYTSSDYLDLSVTLNPDTIKKIREYNRYKSTNSGGYLDNSLINCKLETSLDGVNQRFSNCESTFIDEIQSGSGALGIIENKINVIRSDE